MLLKLSVETVDEAEMSQNRFMKTTQSKRNVEDKMSDFSLKNIKFVLKQLKY